MPQRTYKTQYVAETLGIHTNSVRLWCEMLSPFLSAGANPTGAQYRRFTDEDIATMQLARQLRDEGMGWPEIIADLAERTPSDRSPIVDAALAPIESDLQPQALLLQQIALLERVEAHLAALEHRQGKQDPRPSTLAASIVLAACILAIASMTIVAILTMR